MVIIKKSPQRVGGFLEAINLVAIIGNCKLFLFHKDHLSNIRKIACYDTVKVYPA